MIVITSASSPAGTITATYDRLNRPLTVTVSGDAGATTSYTYSLSTPAWTDPSGSYGATLDKFDRQVSLLDPIHGSSPFSWTYRADGQPASSAAPNGSATTYTYDAAGAPATKVTVRTQGNQARASYGWSRNRAGNILSETSTIVGDPSNGTTAYTYDRLGRLTGYSRAATSAAYEWQAVPNRSSVQEGTNPGHHHRLRRCQPADGRQCRWQLRPRRRGPPHRPPRPAPRVGAELPLDI